jgi:hypothetical protein
MDNHLKPKLITHFTHLAYYLHCRSLIAIKCFECIDYNETIQNISHVLGLMSQYQEHEQAQKYVLTQSHIRQQSLKL